MEWGVLAAVAAVIMTPIAGYFGAQLAMRTAIAQLQVLVDQLNKRMDVVDVHRVDLAVAQVQLDTTRQEVGLLRTLKHDIIGTKRALSMLVSLLAPSLGLKVLPHELRPRDEDED